MVTPTAETAFSVAREDVLAALDRMYEAGDSDGIDAAESDVIGKIRAAARAAKREADISEARAELNFSEAEWDEIERQDDVIKALENVVIDLIEAANVNENGALLVHFAVRELMFTAVTRGCMDVVFGATDDEVRRIADSLQCPECAGRVDVVNALDAAAIQSMYLAMQVHTAILNARAAHAGRPNVAFAPDFKAKWDLELPV